jgi:glycosyltransferase involved in cell wall biosynthesis
MHIHIVTINSGWILQKIAERVMSNYPYDDVKFTMGYYTIDQNADVNYYVDIENCYRGYKTKLDVAYFSHAEGGTIHGLINEFRARNAFTNLDGVISMNKRYTDMLVSIGYPSSRVATIVPGETKDMFPLRKIIIGVVSRGTYAWYGKEFVGNFFNSYNCTNFRFRFLGRDWESIYPIVKAKNIDAEFITDDDYSIYPDFYKNIDYLLIQCLWTAGPMAMQEALSTGVPIISADVGFVNHEFKADYVFEPGNVAQLSAILDSVQLPRLQRRSQVENMSWKKYSTDVVNFILKIKGDKN